MAETPADPSTSATPTPEANAETEKKPSKRKSSVKPAAAAAAAEGQASAPTTAAGETAAPSPAAATTTETSAAKRKDSKRKSTRKSQRKSVSPKKEGNMDPVDEDDQEESEVPKIIYPIDPKIQETMRKAWTRFIKKGQKKKTEIAELDIPTVMRSIGINPTEAQVREIIANTRAQDVTTASKGFFTYECFEQRMAESFQLEPDKFNRIDKDRILDALYTITVGSSEVDAADLKKIMMTKGDTMTEQEAALMVRNAGDQDTGKVYLEEYGDVLSKDGIPQPPPDPTVW